MPIAADMQPAKKGRMSNVDPTVVTTIISAVRLLMKSAASGAASEAGKAVWQRVQKILGWDETFGGSTEVESKVRAAIRDDPEIARSLTIALQQNEREPWGQLVGHIDAQKVVVAGTITTVNM